MFHHNIRASEHIDTFYKINTFYHYEFEIDVFLLKSYYIIKLKYIGVLAGKCFPPRLVGGRMIVTGMVDEIS
jgi:hypothetical protein